MAAIRHALMTRKGWLAWACALALAVRMLVPTGYMPARIGGLPAFELCPDAGPAPAATMPAMHHMGGKHHDHGKQANSTCPFAIAAMAATAGGDAILLAVPVIAPVAISLVLGEATPRQRTARLRPPAQGPPAP